MKSKGAVYLVGAGPGDAGLMTMRGAELLGRADVVVYDALVDPGILRLARATAEMIFRGSHGSREALPQEDINKLLIAKAREGKCVVRLKGGDPYVFGRGGEEAEDLAAAGVPFEVVPGVSSSSAIPNYAGIPITHREHCSNYMVITGHEDPASPGKAADWAAMAKVPGTKIVLMGIKRIRQIARSLIENGMTDKTPVAVVRWGTTGRQRSVTATLGTIADAVETAEIGPPAVMVIGDVVTLRDRLNWFERRPFFGKRIVVTRSRDQASEVSRPLAERGAEVLEIPTIKTVPPTDVQDVMDAILGLNGYDWIVFTSANGVDVFFNYFFKAFDDLRDIGGVRLAAVGPATAARLKQLHLQVDLMPQEYVASEIVKAFAKFESIENLRILLARAEVANRELPQKLEEMGAIVDDVPFYKTVAETDDANGAAASMLTSGADWITFTSGSTVENFHARFNLPELLKKFPGLKLASIGPETTKAVHALQLKPAVEAKVHTIDGLIEAMEAATTTSK